MLPPPAFPPKLNLKVRRVLRNYVRIKPVQILKEYLITPTFVRIQFNFEFLFKTIFNFFCEYSDQSHSAHSLALKIDDKKDVRWRKLYNFHVSFPPLYHFLDPLLVADSMHLRIKLNIRRLPGKFNKPFWTLHCKTGRFLWRVSCLSNGEDSCKNIAQHSIDTSINQHQKLQGRLYQLSGEILKLFNWGKCLKFVTIL